MKKEIGITANYNFSIASEEVIWRMLSEWIWSPIGIFLNEEGKIVQLAKHRVTKMFRHIQSHWLQWRMEKFKNEVKFHAWHNIVPLVLRQSFASLIAWNTVTPTFQANYLALWSGNTTPANSDTTLANETLRGEFTEKFNIQNVAYLDKFFSSSEVWDNTYLEAGVFVDWTASADTWFLLSRILIDEAMSFNETLTINTTFTIS